MALPLDHKIVTPLRLPISTAIPQPANSISTALPIEGARCVATQAMTRAQQLVVAMIERLMQPVSIVMAIANASTPSTGICDATDWKLALDQNTPGICRLNTTMTTAINSSR